MNKKNKEIHDAIKAKFSTNKTGDEIFTDRLYWATVPIDEEGTAHENPRSNPDVLPASVSPWAVELTDDQQDRLDAIVQARLTPRERQIVELLGTGLTLEKAGRKLGISVSTVFSALKSARKKIVKKSTQKKARP